MAVGNTILANSTAVTNVEVYISNATMLVANTVGNGNSWMITMGGLPFTAGEKTGPIAYKLKFGANASANDATVCQVNSSRDVGDSTPFAAQFIVTLRANSAGNVAPVLAVTGYELGTNKGAVNSAVVAVASNGAGYINSNSWILGTSFQGGDSVSNATFFTAAAFNIPN
jgi:hypothetical protein